MIQKKSVKSELFDNISRYFVNFGAVLFVLSIVAIVFNSIFGFSHSIAFSNWLLILISSTIMCIAAMLCNYYDYKGNLSFIIALGDYLSCMFIFSSSDIYLSKFCQFRSFSLDKLCAYWAVLIQCYSRRAFGGYRIKE